MRVPFVGLAALLLSVHATFSTKQKVIEKLILANDYWITRHRDPGNNKWNRAVYFEGLMALFEMYPNPSYYNHAQSWAEDHSWDIRKPTANADNQAAGQTYLDLYSYEPEDEKIESIKASVDAMVSRSKADDWWWIDALQMAMPVFTRLGVLYNDTEYFDKMHDLYDHTKSVEGGHGLHSDNGFYAFGDYPWWRDRQFDPPRKSPNNRQVYWSRGNGWVIAALVRTLDHLPTSDPRYNEYMQTFKNMSHSLKDRVSSGGFWPVNLDDPDHAKTMDNRYTDVPETSGTAFFTYALAWGINSGHLSEVIYRPLVEAAWNAMVNTSLHPNGRVGWVQGVGLRPGSSQPFGYDDTEDFGVGAFLLAGSQVARMASGLWPEPTYSYKKGNTLIFLRPSRSSRGYSGVVTIEFTVTPKMNNMDGVVLLSDSSVPGGARYSRAYMLVRMAPSGLFDCRNASRYISDASVAYRASESYGVRVVGDLFTQTYDVFVAAKESPEVQIAGGYHFRDTAPPADDIGKMVARSPRGQFTMRNVRASESAPSRTSTMSPTVTASRTPTTSPTATASRTPTTSPTVTVVEASRTPTTAPAVDSLQPPTTSPTCVCVC